MLEVFEKIKDAEKEAQRIIDEANSQAEKIRIETERKVEDVYRSVYNETVAEARRKSLELEKKAKEKAEVEGESFLRNAEKQVKEVRTRAEKRFEEAVDTVLNEILSLDR